MLLLERLKFLRTSVARAKQIGIPVAWLMKTKKEDLKRLEHFKEAAELGYVVLDTGN